MTQQKTQIVLINADAGLIWAAGATLEAAKAEVERECAEPLVWEETVSWQQDEAPWTRYEAVEVPAGEWWASDTERARESGNVVAYFRCAYVANVVVR